MQTQEMKQRTKRFAVRVVKLVGSLPRGPLWCVIAAMLLAGCGQTRSFTGTYDEVWKAAHASFGPNRVDRAKGHLAYQPEDAPFGKDGFGVIYHDVWIEPVVDDSVVREFKVRVHSRGQDLLNPFPFLHGYPELEEKKLNRIELELLNIQDPLRSIED